MREREREREREMTNIPLEKVLNKERDYSI
jgi:hypothetical protein